jgi:hypothetical protein
MSTNSKLSVMVTSYLDPALRRRMLDVQKRKPRLTISKQVAQCVEHWLSKIEAEAGIKKIPHSP